MQACLPCLLTVFYSIPLGCLVHPGGRLYSRELQVRACSFHRLLNKFPSSACFLLAHAQDLHTPRASLYARQEKGRDEEGGMHFSSSRSRILASRGSGGGRRWSYGHLPAGFSHMHASHIEEEDYAMPFHVDGAEFTVRVLRGDHAWEVFHAVCQGQHDRRSLQRSRQDQSLGGCTSVVESVDRRSRDPVVFVSSSNMDDHRFLLAMPTAEDCV
ncbi:hypothetical protein BJ166DRAFT_141105 [Pestalotiopsis sp. NC0098]|nr:hypothetical protein BJ166DRAFT_141105 [Pestalotiopsis sp. NC0098]